MDEGIPVGAPVYTSLPVSDGNTYKIKFLDNGRKAENAKYGASWICLVEYEGQKRSLWIRDPSPLMIGIKQHVPLTGKTFLIQSGNETKDGIFIEGRPQKLTARYKVEQLQ